MSETEEPQPDGGQPEYVMADVEAHADRLRLEKLEGLHDAATLRRIDTIGLAEGARCLEIGAGAGSIAREMTNRAGPNGLVVAADIDPRFLSDFDGPGRQVVTHDIQTGPVAPYDFDLAHCRAVLTHVADLPNAVGNFVASVRPGGWILCEEPDYASMAPCDPDHPHAWDLASFHAIMTLSGRTNGSAGRQVFQEFLGRGLTGVRSDIHSAIAVGGSELAHFRLDGLQNAKSLILDSGFFTEESFNRMVAMFNDPSFAYVENMWVATWGQRPI